MGTEVFNQHPSFTQDVLAGRTLDVAFPPADFGGGAVLFLRDTGVFYERTADAAGVPGWTPVSGPPRFVPVDGSDIIAWKMDELAGATVANYGTAGAPGDGTLNAGAALRQEGLFGYGVGCEGGTNDTRDAVVSAAGLAALRPAGLACSVSVWILANTVLTSPCTVFGRMFTATNVYESPYQAIGVQLAVDNTARVFLARGGVPTATPVPLPRRVVPGAWSLITTTYDGRKLNAYFNQSLVLAHDFGSVAAIDWGTDGRWAVGAIPSTGCPATGIDAAFCDFRVASVVRTAAEVAARYRRGVGLATP